MHRFVVILAFLAVAGSANAQSEVSGKWVIEPIIGYHLVLMGTQFDFGDDDLVMYGGRATWRLSYDRSILFELATGASSHTWTYEYGDGGRTETTSTWRRTVVTVGYGSTLLDRDVTGGFGAHAVISVGYIGDPSKSRTVDRASPGANPNVRTIKRLHSSTCVNFGVQLEREIGSPRVLVRAGSSVLLGIEPSDDYHGTIWLPGFTFTGGIAAAI